MFWYSHLFKHFLQFVVMHTVRSFGIVNKAEIDVFMAFTYFFDDPMDVSNLIFGSFAYLNPAKHLEFLGSCTVEALLEEFCITLLVCEMTTVVQ